MNNRISSKIIHWGLLMPGKFESSLLIDGLPMKEDGWSPLHVAIKSSPSHVCDVITCMVRDLGAHVNVKTRGGETSLHIALKHTKPEHLSKVVKTLLACCSKVDARDNGLRTAYDIALERQVYDVADVLEEFSHRADVEPPALEEFSDKERADPSDSNSAGLEDQSDVAVNKETEIQKGKGPDKSSTNESDVPVAKDDELSDANERDIEVENGTEYSAADKKGDTLDKIIEPEFKDPSDDLVDAVICSRQTDIDRLISEGADTNHINKHGAAAIHYSITHYEAGKQELLSKLLTAGADINLTDHEGDTALNLVIKMADSLGLSEAATLVSFLLKSGASTSPKDVDGYDARGLAKKRKYTDILNLLGITVAAPKQEEPPKPLNPTPPPPKPRTPTPEPPREPTPPPEREPTPPPEQPEPEPSPPEESVPPEDPEPSEEPESPPEQSDPLNTPLHDAVLKQDKDEVIRILARDKPDIQAKNKDDETPADVAKRLSYEDIYEILEKHRKEELNKKFKQGAKKASTCLVM